MKFNVLKITALLLVLLTAISCILAACAADEEGSAGDLRHDIISENLAKRTTKVTMPAITTRAPANRDDLVIIELNEFTENQVALYHAIWEVYKDDPRCKDCTINDVMASHALSVWRFDEVLIGTFQGVSGGFYLKPSTIYEEKIGEYTITYGKYGTGLSPKAYANDKEYTLQEAYAAGLLSDEEVRVFCEEFSQQFAEWEILAGIG